MFKNDTNENDFYRTMNDNLKKIAFEESPAGKFTKALGLTVLAAEAIESAGLEKESELLTVFLEKIAEGKDLSAKESAKLTKNLEETGTPFPKSDYSNAEDDGKLKIDEDNLKTVKELISPDLLDAEDFED